MAVAAITAILKNIKITISAAVQVIFIFL